MPPLTRVRQLAPAVVAVGLALALGACVGGEYPNSTFNHTTDLNAATDRLWDKLLFWGTAVFVIVEAILIYVVIRFRKRPDSPPPQMTHGNTALEITWTVLPVVILVLIAVPTVQTIFRTQAPAPDGALEIEVIGHQWWWEYKYPQHNFATANEFYIPKGRSVNFTLRTADVLHAFWVPQLGGKRDLISTQTNYLWYTPNTDLATSVWNGFCTEYCGDSHANMRIRAYVVEPAEFDAWVAGQKAPAAVSAPAAPAAGTAAGSTPANVRPVANVAAQAPPAPATPAQAAPAPVGYTFPKEQLPEYAIPRTPFPKNLTYNDALLAQGDVERGRQLFSGAKAVCASCHFVNPVMASFTGPNLTHLASRHTIAAGLYPNDGPSLARWIKNSVKMKPGSKMYILGEGETNPTTNAPNPLGKLTDAEIADIVAYLLALK
jgi:cytochrome c oxidase subunit 2